MSGVSAALRRPDEAPAEPWSDCSFLTCSVLPVRVACNLGCPFCFSKSSVSALRHEAADWRAIDVLGYYRFARERGATRLVITGGGEPLLRPDDVVFLVEQGAKVFREIACFTNGTFLTAELAQRLADAGLSYLCWSRHEIADEANRALMGPGAPSRAQFLESAAPLKVRATCVMSQGHVDSKERVLEYVRSFRADGVREFTFKHTYVAYPDSVFQGSPQNRWAAEHRTALDPFEGSGNIVGRLPWGPVIRQLEGVQVCHYREPTPAWELENRLCRSTNLLSDGSVYASLEAKQSLLYRLKRS